MWSDKYSDDTGGVPQNNTKISFWNPFESNLKKPQSNKTNELDLSNFKTQKCINPDTKHNKKHCVNYHNDNDRRRNPTQYNYKCDFCVHGRNCPNQDSCDLSHNKVEQLYHPNRYKSKYCQSKSEDCEYGIFCTFAHSDDEINIPLKLHLMTQDQNFWLNSYKTVWCPYIQDHDRAYCVYAHNAQDFRRDPTIFKYNPVDCPNWQKTKKLQLTTYEQGGCPQMFNCLNCHGWKELEYHPQNYRSKKCQYGDGCNKKTKDCAYYHTDQDRRMKNVQKTDIDQSKKPPPPPPYKNDFNESNKKIFSSKYQSNYQVVGPIIPDQQYGQKKGESALSKKKLQMGQPFEVFSSNSLTNHTSSGSRKMSETSQEGKSVQNYVKRQIYLKQKQPMKKKEQSPKKNRTAPSTPEQQIQIPFFQKYHDDQIMESFNISLPYQIPLIFSTQFIDLLNKYENYEILTILQQNTINESKLMGMIDIELDQLLMLTTKQIQVVKQVVSEMNQDLLNFMQSVDTQF